MPNNSFFRIYLRGSMTKSLYVVLLTLHITIPAALAQGTVPGRMETEQGRFIIESYRAVVSGDSVALVSGDVTIAGHGLSTGYNFAAPLIMAVPVKTVRYRTAVDPDAYAGNLRAVVLDLSEEDDKLRMELEVRLSRDVMNRRLGYLLVPELRSQSNSAAGPGVLINGQVRDQLYRRKLAFGAYREVENIPDCSISVTTYADTLLHYSLMMPYELWMDDAVLDIHQVLGSPADKEQLYTISGAGRVKLQPREPYTVTPRPNMVTPPQERKIRRMQGQAYLDFQTGRSVIVPTFRRNPEELGKIQAAIMQVQADKDVEINGLFIEGYASPDGSYALNHRLAHERSQALANYISRNFDIPYHMINVSSVAEDWDGLRILVEGSDLVRRDEILAVIDSSDEPDQKERRLKAMGWPWTAMSSDMFPQLRRVEYQIDFTVRDYSVDESEQLMSRNPEMLSQRELFTLARLHEAGSDRELEVFDLVMRLYPDDPTAILNYAAVLLSRGELAAAKRYLDRVADRPEAIHNLGVYYLAAGELDRAEPLLRQAASTGVAEASHNLSELDKKREDIIKMERFAKRAEWPQGR